MTQGVGWPAEGVTLRASRASDKERPRGQKTRRGEESKAVGGEPWPGASLYTHLHLPALPRLFLKAASNIAE